MMKRYKCHKEDHAGKITSITIHQMGAELVLEDGQKLDVPTSWLNRHDPKAGGYYVLYEDGYASWSPSQAFENGYTEMTSPRGLKELKGEEHGS